MQSRFPAPPRRGQMSTRDDTRRSKEAPMQFEWQESRDSTFGLAGDERPQKRTHFEAMDVDTPPRALPPPTTFSPSSCEVSADLFGFQTPMETDPTPIPSTSTLPPFNSKEFDAKESFGLATPSASPSDSLIIAETRRRKPIKKERIERRSSSSSRSDVEEDLNDSNAFGGIVANRMGKGAFSFQVHHHHGQNSNGFDNSPVKKKKWLDKSTPYTLLGYLHFTSLALLLLLLLSLIILFLHTIKTDVQQRLAALTIELRAEIISCAKAYVDNNCDSPTRGPLLAPHCSAWELCMEKEVVVVGKAKIVAEILADVVNGFVEVISLKTMLFVTITLVTTIYCSSVALSLLPTRTPVSAVPIQQLQQNYPPSFQNLGYPQQSLPGYGYSAPNREKLLTGMHSEGDKKGWF